MDEGATNTVKMGMLETFMKSHQNSLKSLFHRKKSDDGFDSAVNSPKLIPQLSLIANSVFSRCSKILEVSTEELQHQFDIELPESVKELFTYSRNLVEFSSYQALDVLTRRPDYLIDKEFCRLTYDMMLAWEDPSVESAPQDNETASCSNQEEAEDEDGWSLFYSSSTSMAVQVDDKKTVGREAFGRIAPVCAAIADIITVGNLFDALTSSSNHRLHFLIYDRYLRSLDKVVKAAKNSLGPSVSNYQFADGEIILDIDGTIPTQPVLQHIGISAWPGRLTLTNHALYFESLGVGLYEKPIRYDLATEMKQVIKPELTGPLGARIFDKAVMYKSMSVVEPVYFEFPEFKGSCRRDYWLGICLEVLHAHRFIRKNNFKEIQQSEVIARATLSVFQNRAVREAFHFFSSQYRTLLSFNLAETLPGGDIILETLARRLALLNVDSASPRFVAGTASIKQQSTLSPVAVLSLDQFGLNSQKHANIDGETIVRDFGVGVRSPLEIAMKQSISDTGMAQAAQATVDQVKVEGIDTNVAVMKELLFPVIDLACHLQLLASWEHPSKSISFLALTSYAIIRGWIRYALPGVFIFLGGVMLWRRNFNQGMPLEAFRVIQPPTKNPVEQLLILQEGISQVEVFIQAVNIFLLKLRALLFAVLPQATDRVAVLLILVAGVLVLLPVRYLTVMVFVEGFTRQMPYRRESNDRWVRRVREWWVKIPAAPVRLIKPLDNKKKKP